MALTGRRSWIPQSIENLDAWIEATPGGMALGSGVALRPETALYLTAVYAAVRVLSSAVASCPLVTFRQTTGGREETPDHPLYDLLRWSPNPEMTAFEFWEMSMGHLLLWGNFYAELERNPYGVVALWPLRPDRMRLARDSRDELVYVYNLGNGQNRLFPFSDILHVRGQAVLDPLSGRSAVYYGAEAIALGLATESFGSKFFANDSRPGGVLTVDGKLSDEAASRLKTQWDAMHSGAQNRWRVAVLENGVTWQAVGVPPEQAQFLETRQFQRTEIAGLFGVPPHLIGDLSRATWANIEHQSIEFVTHSVEPWTTRIEMALRRDVFRISAGKRSHRAEFDTKILKQGDQLTRSQALAIMRQNGVISADDWRQAEGMNPTGDEAGSVLLVNGTMIPVSEAAAPPPPPPPPAPVPATPATTEEPQ
jgi:HK97 family phage portal protein